MSFLGELILEAARSLARHKLRSLLTTLGIIFGVASVISMVAIGEGARRTILEQIQELGTRNIIINARKPPEDEKVGGGDEESWTLRYGLTFRDAAQIERTLPVVQEVLSVHDVEKWIWFRSRRIAAKVRGVTAAYFDRLHLEPFLGRAIQPDDEVARRRVCVIRAQLLREARYAGDPLRLDLKIGDEYFRVVGVLADDELQSTNRAVLGIDGRAMEVYVPFQSVVGRFGLTQVVDRAGSQERTIVELHQIVCAIDTEAHVIPAARGIHAILASFHDRKDYDVTVPLELLASQQRTQRVFNVVLPIIAGISLIVGGIGILNIMLASVTERTREIGIRRAIGATGWDITWQFLIETVTLAFAGGVLGLALGIGGVYVLEATTEWKVAIPLWSVVLSLGVAVVTGLLFGIYPAWRAAKMDPIAALRHG